MSADVLPSPPQDKSLLYRLSYTPLRDALRGNWTLSLDYRLVVDSSDLPASLKTFVGDVVRRSRLWDSEKLDVTRELVLHFMDGISAGHSANELIETFGAPAIGAKLIRRAKMRNRGLLYRAARKIVFVSGLVVLIVFLTILSFFIRFNAGSPTITRNYVAEFNADTRSIPESLRAWPLYKEAFLSMSPWPDAADVYPRQPINPSNKQWPGYVAYYVANSKSVELFRQGAKRMHLGAILSDACDPDLVRICREPFGRKPRSVPSDNPKLTEVLHPEEEVLMQGFGLLRLDALASLESEEADRCFADIEGILGIVRHLLDPKHSSNRLAGAAFMLQACDLIGGVLRDNPELLSSDQCISISHQLASFDFVKVVRDYLVVQKTMFDDLVQRIYTDDGSGDGRLTAPPEAFGYFFSDPAYCAFTEDTDRSVTKFERVVIPAISPYIAGRCEITAVFNDLQAISLRELATPLWLRDDARADQVIISWYSGNDLRRFKYLPISIFYTSMSLELSMNEVAAQQRDATAAAIAVELFRRKTGEYPSSLAQLVPQLLPAVPTDRFDGNQIRYRLANGQPLVYSVGADKIDDGGKLEQGNNPSNANSGARHWIPPSRIEESLQNKTLRRGDWILWPPVEY